MTTSADPLVFLRSYFVEVVSRYLHLSNFLQQTNRESRGETPNLLFNFSKQLSEQVRDLVRFYPTVSKAPAAANTVLHVSGPFEDVVQCAVKFQRMHKKLRWFPSPWPETELFQFLTQVCKEKGLEDDFRALNPTVVFSDEYNFLTSDVNRSKNQDGTQTDQRTRLIVWALPKCEMGNPLLWPVLAHEVAHGMFQEKGSILAIEMLSKKHEKRLELLKSWATELNADLFAFRILGPAYLYCLIYFSIFFIDFNLHTPVRRELGDNHGSHPPPAERIRLLAREFDNRSIGASERLREIRTTKERMMSLYDIRLKLEQHVDPPEYTPSQKDDERYSFSEEEMDELWDIIHRTQYERFPDLDMKDGELEDCVTLAKRLERKQIASSILNPDGKDILRRYLRKRFDEEGLTSGIVRLDWPSNSEQKQHEMNEDKALTRERSLIGLNERPAKISQVLNAGWIEKVTALFNEPTPEFYTLALTNEPALQDILLEPSRQLRKSIQVALVLSSIKEYSGPISPRY